MEPSNERRGGNTHSHWRRLAEQISIEACRGAHAELSSASNVRRNAGRSQRSNE